MAQRVTWRWDSDAFGSLPPNTDPDGDGNHDSVNLRFPGQYFDKASGLHYNYCRDYDPSLGRYIQSDPIGLGDGPNTYAYVRNNPLKYYDPNGEAAHVAIGAGVGAVFTSGAYVLTTDNFTWSGLLREAAIGAVVGGVTAAVPGAGSLNFGGRAGKTLAGFGTAAAAGTSGSLLSQSLQCGPIDYSEALIAGGANAAGFGIGRAFQTPAKSLSTTNIPARPGMPLTSPTGRSFALFSRPARQIPNEAMQQVIQDTGGAIISTAINQSR